MEIIKFYYEEINTPVGPLLVIRQGECVLRIDFGKMTELQSKHVQWFSKFYENPIFIQTPKINSHIRNELKDYFEKKRKQFSFEFKLHGTPFQQKVWKTLYQTTPYGQTKSYQDLAKAINHPKAVRAIGGAMKRNPISIVVPCHRVIGKNHTLVGYGGGLNKKQFLLNHEGYLQKNSL